MHIEPGLITGAKMLLGYATAAGVFSVVGKMTVGTIKEYSGAVAFAIRSLITTALVFCFFQLLPHPAVGVSEVHLILGSTLFLLFGTGPAAAGLALGLLIQGVFFAPFDLPQYCMNVTTLLVPLVVIHKLAQRLIAPNTPYVDISYKQALTLSVAYQGGIVSWVAFWSFYGQGFTWASVSEVSTFGAAYMSVVIIEPLVDLALLGVVKTFWNGMPSLLFNHRLRAQA